MADEQTQGQAVVEQPKDEAALMAEMNQAVKSGDYKAVAKVASELVKFQKAKEQAEYDAKVKALAEVELKVKSAIAKAIQPFVEKGELDSADGVWFAQDFGEKLVTCRLMKVAVKKASGGGGGGAGKKFSVSTSELLEKFGADEYKDGQTFQAAWDSNVDKNWRYAIREALLKKAGVVS